MVLRRSNLKERIEPEGEHDEVRRSQPLVAGARKLAEPSEKLGELLVRHDRVSHTQLNEALLQQSASGKRIGSLLVELGALSDVDLAHALSEQFNLEYIDLGRVTPDPAAL